MRKYRAKKRDVLPDPVYNSKMITKLVNQIMIGGKKGTAQKILYDAFDIIKKETLFGNNKVDKEMLENLTPMNFYRSFFVKKISPKATKIFKNLFYDDIY